MHLPLKVENHFICFIKPFIIIVNFLLLIPSIHCLHSLCAATNNFKMSLNCANSSSTVTLFLLEWNRSSMAPLFLRSLEYSLYLLSLIQFETICIPFHLMIVSLLFVLSQNYFGFLELNCFVSAGPVLVDVSHLESLISTSVYHLRDL